VDISPPAREAADGGGVWSMTLEAAHISRKRAAGGGEALELLMMRVCRGLG
jgi:hypothetical protein